MLKELEIIVKRIPESGINLDTAVSAKDIELEYSDFYFLEKIKLNLNVNLVDKEIIVRGKGSFTVRSFCNRCLADVDIFIEHKDILIDYENKGQEIIDLSPDIRDEIIIKLPSKILCNDDCKGICPKCKVNLNNEKCECSSPPQKNNPFKDL